MALTFDVLRPDDLLSLSIEAQNLRLDTTDPKQPVLVVDNKSLPAFLIVTFPPQSITEKAYFEVGNIKTQPAFNSPPPGTPPLGTTDDPLDPAGQTPARMSGPSRLVFQLPKKVTKIPFQIESLLDWTELTPVVSSVAQGKPSPLPITEPGPLETALELPYRLFLSPGTGTGWINALAPVTYGGRTELWHTRLAKVVKVTAKGQVSTLLQEASLQKTIPLRAIWSPDFHDHQELPGHNLDLKPFLTPLSPRDRAQIVILTSGTNGYYTLASGNQPGTWTPTPIHASRVFLSALGGWLTSRGNWWPLPVYNIPLFKLPTPVKPLPTPVRPLPAPVKLAASTGVTHAAAGTIERLPFETVALDLTEWDHLATEGRDHYVKVVYEGYLYPFGHAATLVKVTERKFVPAELVPPAAGYSSSVTAILRQHMYIVVREQEKSYPASGYAFGGREMPFYSRVRIDTKVTPDIDPPPQSGDPGFFSQYSFWVTIEHVNFQFHLTGQDLAGAEIDFLAPLIFVSVSENDVGAVYPAVSDAGSVKVNYVKGGLGPVSSVRGRKIAYADPSAGDTSLKTSGLYFDTQITSSFPYASAPFIPLLSQAEAVIPSVEELLGITTPVDIQFYQRYLQNGLDPNAGVFVDVSALSGQPLPTISFTAQKAGGFATPGFTITALSARKGMVAGSPDDAANGVIDPSIFFGGLSISPKLFGTIPLGNLIPVDTHQKAPANKNAPEIRTKELPNNKQPTQVVTTVKWSPDLTDYSLDPVQIEFNQDGNNSTLSLLAQLIRPLDGSPSQASIQGKLSNFEITLLGVVAIIIDSIVFTSNNGSKTNVVVKLADKNAIQFIGPLHFIQTLADVLPPGLFGGDGPSIDLAPTGLRVSYTLGLPPISIGVFSLENIAITAGVDLPYLDGKPGFEFAFAKRSSPFLLTVECLGGGGFVHLILNADGIQMVEGSLEFGGEFSIDLGVASGGVHIMAGIYFQLAGTNSTLTGFVDIGGEVSVMGIISISIDLNLSLSFIHTSSGDKIQGRATLKISVSILFFSISVSVSVERSFGSGGGDPKIADVISDKDWQAYCLGFAG